MDILELITADHDEVADLIDRLASIADAGARTREAMELARRLAVALKTHARAEERVLYEAIRAGSSDLALVALEEPHAHHALDVVLDKLVVQRPGRELAAILRVIERLFVQHARVDEEGEILPAIGAAILPEDRARLARDFLVEKRRIRPAIARLVGAPVRTSDPRGLHFHVHGHRR